MSSDPKATPNAGSIPLSQEWDIDRLQAIGEGLSDINSMLARQGGELSEQDLAKVLEQLKAAEVVADDVEGKLDELLKNLGGMLEGLEADKGEGQGTDAEGKRP
ncbi:unnamed protein product [Rhizoctonia solani]|uniref:Uncharacterized protein n=1 Tax=Rhizoctonia solani TaxID=456999 RepID=A0A8H3DHF1_9AGAM|nr:unnamed protein product [Rhizoctonia solani]